MLRAYAAFLRENHLQELAQENLRLLVALETPLIEKLGPVPESEQLAQVRASLASLLAAMEAGRAAEHAAERLRLWAEGKLPHLPAEVAHASDTLIVYAAQESALVAFIGRFTRSIDDGLAIALELRRHYTRVHDLAVRVLVEASEAAAARAARLEAAQEVAGVYAQDLEHLNTQLTDEVARKRAIIGSALDAVVTIDQDNRILEFNPAAEQIFGFAAEEVVGRDLLPLLVPERYREAHNRGIKHFIATGEGPALSKRVELPALRKDGSEFPAEFVIIHLPLEGKTIFTSFIRDLSEQKQALEAQKQLEALKHADKLKEQFLGILSHELRTPINAITGFGTVLEDGLAGELSEVQCQYVSKMLASADTLLALVDDLLDMSRIQAGKFTLHPDRLKFQAAAGEVIEMLAALAEQKHLTLLNEVSDELPEVQADPQRIGQVLTNYINNAIKFTPAGGTIRVRAFLRGDHLYCEVQDTGEGIAEADIPKLFQRFGQLDTSNTRTTKGVGLGLSISKALIEAHGGVVGVRSEVGEGATFWFTLPLSPGPSVLADA